MRHDQRTSNSERELYHKSKAIQMNSLKNKGSFLNSNNQITRNPEILE